MKLFLLKRNPELSAGYDELYEIVVRAVDRAHAREIAAEYAGDEGPAIWRLSHRSTCIELEHEGPAGVICKDFLEGE